ncbi:MAG TPA: flagellar protein FlaG [Armatimonadetes bacterium]|nr:flagellar protein FlaG [Armatimonadota bacterium]
MTDVVQPVLRRIEPSDAAILHRDTYPGARPSVYSDRATARPTGNGPNFSEVRQAIDCLNEAVKTLEISVRFRILDEPRQVVVEMYDTTTGDVIREIPPRRLLRMYADMMHLVGLSLDRKA